MEQIIKPELKLDSKLLVGALVRLMKRDISERFAQTREVTDEDWEFCEKIDWHPVDELPPKPEHIEELKKALKETPTGKTYNSAEEFFDSLK
jgi:hypothetical protein